MDFKRNITTARECPYCGSEPKYMCSSVIYGKPLGMIYICEPCDAFVGVHHKTSRRSLGRLANKELRGWRRKTHIVFDGLWKRGILKGRNKREVRNAAYEWLASELSINVHHCHIAMFDIALCKRTIEICKVYSV